MPSLLIFFWYWSKHFLRMKPLSLPVFTTQSKSNLGSLISNSENIPVAAKPRKIQSKTATKLKLLKVLGVNASLKSISIVFDRFEFASDLGVV